MKSIPGEGSRGLQGHWTVGEVLEQVETLLSCSPAALQASPSVGQFKDRTCFGHKKISARVETNRKRLKEVLGFLWGFFWELEGGLDFLDVGLIFQKCLICILFGSVTSWDGSGSRSRPDIPLRWNGNWMRTASATLVIRIWGIFNWVLLVGQCPVLILGWVGGSYCGRWKEMCWSNLNVLPKKCFTDLSNQTINNLD